MSNIEKARSGFAIVLRNKLRKFIFLPLIVALCPAIAHAYGSSTSLNFSLTSTASSSSGWAYLTYSGCCNDNQNFQSWSSTNPSFTLASYPSFIVCCGSFQVEITFKPNGSGNASGQVNIFYYDPASYSSVEYEVYVSGEGATPGFVNPKYVIVGVTYAPPGPNSSVTYSTSTLVGNTETTTNTFSKDVNLTISTTNDISAWTPYGGIGKKLQNTESTDYTQGSNSSTTVTVSKTSTVTYNTSGTGNAFSPVDHDYDVIWLWLNPLMLYSVDTTSPANIQWNGYGYDSNDTAGPDVYGVQVGWLNGDWGDNQSVDHVLARGWVTTNEPGMIWPSGDGPGITRTDIAQILQADPFASGTYSLPSPLPSTTADHRFTQIPYPPNPVTYTQAGPGNGGGITTTYDLENVNTSSEGRGTTTSFQQSFGVEEGFSASAWFNSFSVNLSVSKVQTLKWTHSWEDTLTTTKTLSQALSVTGPGCPQTSPPCVPTYTGPGQFIVFQDNQFGTFMFYRKQ